MKKVISFAVIVAALIFLGCGDDTGTTPSGGIIVLLSPETATINFRDTVEFTAGIFNSANDSILWYVNDILNGNDIYGAITGNSDSAIYIAPDSASSFDIVTVKIVSQADITKCDTAKVLILDPLYVYVDPVNGNDTSGTGSSHRPFKTITTGLDSASIGQTVKACPGTYSEATGEIFPISPPFGISIKGAGADQTIIEAPAGTSIDNAAFKIQFDLTVIDSLAIVGTGGSGVGINFAGSSDTTSLNYSNGKIDSCYIAAVKSSDFKVLTFSNNTVSNCEYGLIVEQPGDTLDINFCSFSNIELVAVELAEAIPYIYTYFLNNTINDAGIGINVGAGFVLINSSSFENIDSIGVIIQSNAYANLGENIFPGDNTFGACGQWCVYNADDDTITAWFNTWPAADSASIDSLIYDDEESGGTSGPVLFDHFNE